MTATVQEVLDARLRRDARRQVRIAFAAALGLHLAATLIFVVVPLLRRATPPRPHFVSVQVLPAAALGRPEAPPNRATPATTPAVRPPAPEGKPSTTSPTKPETKPISRPATPALPVRGAPVAPSAPPTPAAENPAQGSPEGVAGGLALGAAVAGLDNPSFTYGYYLDQMLAQIERGWVRPPLGSGVEALVSFRIQRDGRLTELRIERSSGYSSFDLAGLRAIQAAAPFPPLPRGYAHPSLGVNLILK